MHPEDVGITKSELVLGKHSGRHALKDRLVKSGYALDDAELDRVFTAFKALADKKKEVYDADLEALVLAVTGGVSSSFQLKSLSIQSATGESRMPTASVRLATPDGGEICEAAVGDGPVDALFRALSRAIGAEIVRWLGSMSPTACSKPARARRFRRPKRRRCELPSCIADKNHLSIR